jgi:lipoyl(octanoyl) transferase
MKLHVRNLGRADYARTWEAQLALCDAKHLAPETPDELWLLEHDPVYTIGRTPDQSSLREPEKLPHPVFEINRGGQATFHGPGQLVGYPILDLRERGRDLHRHLRDLERCLIETLSHFSVGASRKPGFTGVWVGEKKIASIGVGVRHWISMHGFALNVCNDLAPFTHITPCGITGVQMTSIQFESQSDVSLDRVSDVFTDRFAAIFGYAPSGIKCPSLCGDLLRDQRPSASRTDAPVRSSGSTMGRSRSPPG